ncbi:MAG: Tad domain-containing protein [Proteobacteria bacterium]|nr:Tad domain-containing protein [Pseudomonadota bacterium]
MSDIRRKISGSGSIGSLIRDRRGAVAVYIAIITPVMIGIGALTLDLGRVITLHSELQYAADSASLAGARELDRFDGAIKRARAAAAGAVTNIQTFAADGGGKEVAIVVTTDCAFPPVPPCVRFLKTLPADDDDPILPSDVTTKDDEARFMEVRVGARAVTNALIQIVTLGSGPSTISTVASAVAGNDQVICRIPPMFMCNPTEPDGNLDLELGVDLAVLAGVQMEMFHQGGTGQYTPGNFGLLCPTGTEGSPCGAGFVRDALASTTGTCVSLNVAETKTGVTLQMVRTGINARHDFYTPQAKTSDNIAWRTLDEFVPAANVTQGGKPPNNTQGNQTKCEYNDIMADVVNAAGQTEAEWIDADPINNTADNFVATGVEETATGFPRDQCINADNCATDGAVAGNQRIGDGNWDYINYYRINHGCDPFANPTCKPADWDGVTGAAGWPPTRYETYRYEIERTPEAIVMPSLIQNIYHPTDGNLITKTKEYGKDQCFQGPTPPVIPDYNYFPDAVRDLTLLKDRRIMPIAIANCNALESLGNKVSGKFTFKIPQFVYVFITEPMKTPSTSEIHAEILGELDEGAMRDLSHDLVQIYRR